MPSAQRRRIFIPSEIAQHCTSDDLWVSFLGRVYDLTPLCQKYRGDVLLKPLLLFGGKDITHWFNEETQDVRTYVDPFTECVLPYTPHGRYIHIPPEFPCSDWANDFPNPWWKNDLYCIGNLSKKTRFIQIINTLSSQEHTIEVGAEETIEEILRRYLRYNAHAESYTWKYAGKNLDMEKTLEENGIKDDDEEFYRLGLNSDDFTRSIHLYFNDDLTEK